MHKEDGITKLIDGEVYYKFDYANFLYEKLQEKDDELDKYKNVIEELKKWLKSQNQPMPNETVGYNYVFKIRISKVLDKLNELLEEVE